MDYMLIPKLFIALFVFLVGVCVGSFLNVLIIRIPKKENFTTTNSHCMSCNHKLHAKDLVPLFSWIFLGGKCRYCKAKISPQYPIVEAFNGIMYTLVFWFVTDGQLNLATVGYCLAISALIVASAIDIKIMEIPDSMWVTILVGGILVYINDLIANGFVFEELIERVIGFFTASTILFVLAVITKGGMGGGDIKLMAACGFLLGWQLVLLSLIFGALSGTIYFIIVYLKNRNKEEKMDHKVPFAPHLALAVAVCIFVGQQFLDWYLFVCGITAPHECEACGGTHTHVH